MNRPWPLLLAALAIVCVTAVSVARLQLREIDREIRMDSPPLQGEAPRHKSRLFRVSVAAMLAPVHSYRTYHELGQRLADALDQPLALESARTYSELNKQLRRGEVDLAFVCSGGYASARDVMDVIATASVRGSREYRAALIVRAHSPARRLIDLRSARAVCTDPLSNSGCWYLRQSLNTEGESIDDFFSQVRYTGSHDRSIQAVASHLADVGSVGTLFLQDTIRRSPFIARQIRLLSYSTPIPNPPVVVRKNMGMVERGRIAEVLFNLPDSPEGRRILAHMKIDLFVPATNEDYAEVRAPSAR